MYRINPNDAQTELYGIQKSDAQVLDNSFAQDLIQQDRQQQFVQGQQKQRDRVGRESKANDALLGINKVAIFDRDRPKFATMQKDLYGYVHQNIDKIRDGDSDAWMGFQQKMGEILTEAELSKNTREKAEQVGQAILQKGIDKFRPEDIDRYEAFIKGGENGEYIGNYDTSELIPKENVNYGERVVKDLSTYAQRMATDSPLRKVFTTQQANELIAADLNDPVYFEQATYDFNRAPDKLGAKTPVEYYQKLYSPKLTVNDTKEAFYTGFGDRDKMPKVSGTYVNQGDGKGEFQFEYINSQDNPYLTIKNPDGGGSVEVKPLKVIYGGETPTLEVATKPRKDADGNDIPGKTMKLNYSNVSEIMNNKFGIKNVFDIPKGNEPSHVTVKRTDISKKEKSKPTISVSAYNKAKKKNYTKAQLEKSFGANYNITD